jgi:hypothetical protein
MANTEDVPTRNKWEQTEALIGTLERIAVALERLADCVIVPRDEVGRFYIDNVRS